MTQEYMDKVIESVIRKARQMAIEENSNEAAYNYIFNLIKEDFRAYADGRGTKAEYDYMRVGYEKGLRKYF